MDAQDSVQDHSDYENDLRKGRWERDFIDQDVNKKCTQGAARAEKSAGLGTRFLSACALTAPRR